MSLHYIIDGYNVINQMPFLVKMKLEDRRNALIQLVEIQRPQGSPKNKVTIVFDGQSGMGGYPSGTTVQVTFSSDESADDEIKRRVEDATQPKNIVVVTDDREIKYFVRNLGAQVVSVKDFLAKLALYGAKAREESREASDSVKSGKESKYISKTLEYQITSELEKVWIERKKKR